MFKTLKDFWENDYLKSMRSSGTKNGGFWLCVLALVVAILIVLNIMFSLLPASWTQLDMSSAQLYSLTANTKVVAGGLDEDVTIYWIVQDDNEDTIIEKLLDKYDALSDHIKIEKINPDVYPTFAKQYTSETVYNNSLVVKSDDKYRYISYEEIYIYDETDYYYSAASAFDGEGAITSAIYYVVSDNMPKIYILNGHGELELGTSVRSAIERSNIELADLSIIVESEIPGDADAILINSPEKDLSEIEANVLMDYVDQGGKLFVLSGPQNGEVLTNLQSILNSYDVAMNEGIVVDIDSDYYGFNMPYMLIPALGEGEITAAYSSGYYYAIMPLAGGLTIGDGFPGQVESLMDTSEESYSKIKAFAMDSYDIEEGDIEGPFSLAVAVTDISGGKIVWIASDYFLDDEYNSYSAGTNLDIFKNGISWMVGENSSNISISAKPLTYEYLTISESAASLLKVIMIGLIPLIYLFVGIDVVIRRRRRS